MDITPGSTVRIQIKRAPRAAAAVKTLTRLCAKDPEVHRRHRTRKRKRPSLQQWRRGGRFWNHRMKSKPPVRLEAGQSYTVRATPDVVRDLASVERFVEVTPV